MSRQQQTPHSQVASSRLTGRRGSRHHRVTPRLKVETLEVRNLLTAIFTSGQGVLMPEAGQNETLDSAQDVGNLGLMPRVGVAGQVGDGPAGPADVDWYRFVLDRPATVDLSAQVRGANPSFKSVLSLYNHDPFNFQDSYNPLGHRLLAQDDGSTHGGNATIGRDLGPGTYYVAISGAGNFDFHPFIAGSGHGGSTGSYNFLISAEEIAPGVEGPTVLTADPVPDAVLSSSPFVIRLGLSGAPGPSANVSQETVRLVFNPVGTFGDGQDQDVSPLGIYYSPAASELQMTLQAPLGPGSYKIIVAGADGSVGGADLPLGRTYTSTFRIAGIEGRTGPGASADDTASTSHDLGDLSGGNFVRIAGAIGDDPFYGPESGLAPGSDVDMYHFRISGTGRYAFVAEVLAGRIGSSLDSGVSLYYLDPNDNTLHFVAGNNNTGNDTRGTDGVPYLITDSVLYVGLTAGDYYLAVSDAWNTPSPADGMLPGSEGLFDPNRSHSGQSGFGTGSYVLNVLARPDAEPPRVVSVSPARGATIAQPPTSLVVRFSEAVNIQDLAARPPGSLAAAIYIEGHDGVRYFPRLVSYDRETHTATFLMLDGLANGEYEIHLSGADGLADLGGNPLAGNDPGGDHVVRFAVRGPDRGLQGNPTDGYSIDANLDAVASQDLGILFPNELQVGVTVRRGPALDADGPLAHGVEVYRFRVLRDQEYLFGLAGLNLPDGARIVLTDDAGNDVMVDSLDSGRTLLGHLARGTYSVRVVGRTAGESAEIEYELRIFAFVSGGNPTPLLDGPAPAIRLRLDSPPDRFPPTPTPTPNPTVPPISTPIPTPTPTPTPTVPPISTPIPTPPASPTPAPPVSPSPDPSPPGGSSGTVVSTVTMGPEPAHASLGVGGDIVFTFPGGGIRPGGDRHSSSAASLFPGELLVLGSGAFGGFGVGESADSPAAETLQLVLQDSAPAVPPGVLELVMLLQPGASSEVGRDPSVPDEGDESSLPEVMALVDESLEHLAAPVARMVETLLDFAKWWTTPPAPSDRAAAPLEDLSPVGAGAVALVQGMPAGPEIGPEADPSAGDDLAPEPERGWLASMATLGMVTFAYASRRRGGRRSGGPRRSADEGFPGSCSGGFEGVPGSAPPSSPAS